MPRKSSPALKPVSTIVRKRSLFVPILAVIIIIAVAVAVYLYSAKSQHGTILASVNGQPIYDQDVASEYNKLPPEYKAQYSKELLLNQTIDKMLLLQEGKRRGLSVTNDEVDKQLGDMMAQFGIGDNDLKKILDSQNITLVSYKSYIHDELLLKKVIDDAVVNRVSVTDEEIAQYYDEHPDEFSAPPGGVIVSHILVQNLTEAQDIINKLAKGEAFNTLAQTYSIDNGTKDQGGFLGVVTNSTPFVQEFKTAALKLSPQQYTRTPVKSVYGYHIIKREEDKEPLRLVRSTIESQLKTAKQLTLFHSLMKDLRSAATIKYYTASGVVTEKTVTAAPLDTFAKCVASKATLYGTSWSEFFKQQQDLFGSSFSYLKFVDCDQKPTDCSAANIQKYPTWIIDGQQYGKMTLQEISDKTGCKLQ